MTAPFLFGQEPPPQMRAAPFQSPLAGLLGQFSRPAGDALQSFFDAQARRWQQNPLSVLAQLLYEQAQTPGAGPTKLFAAKVLPFVRRTGALKALRVPGLKPGTELVTPISAAPSAKARVAAGIEKMRSRLLRSSEGMTLDEVFEEQPLVGKKRVDALLKEHGVMDDVAEMQRFRFQVKPVAEVTLSDGRKMLTWNLAKVLAWLGY